MMRSVELVGLEGENLLAFMAALGTLRVLALAGQGASVRLRWSLHGSHWTPVLEHSGLSTQEEVLSVLASRLCGPTCVENRAFEVGQDLTLTSDEFAVHARAAAAAATGTNRTWADFLAAFGCEAVLRDRRTRQIEDTALRTMSGAGHQHFVGSMSILAHETRPEHLQRALFVPWDYSDGKPSMRWDPNDYRPHALRAEEPAGDPIMTVRGANKLAVESLPFFATMPRRGALETTGFNRDAEITWPIWLPRLDTATVAALVALRALQADDPDRTELEARGIVRVFRARRFTEGKYRNFSPARELI